MGSIPGLGRFPEGGHDNPLQYSCLENPMDRRAWQAIVHSIRKSLTWLKWIRRHRAAQLISKSAWNDDLRDHTCLSHDVWGSTAFATASELFYFLKYLFPRMECLIAGFLGWIWALWLSNWSSYILLVLLVGTPLITRITKSSGHLGKLLWNVCFPFITLSPSIVILPILFCPTLFLLKSPFIPWHDPKVETFLLFNSLAHKILPFGDLSIKHHLESNAFWACDVSVLPFICQALRLEFSEWEFSYQFPLETVELEVHESWIHVSSTSHSSLSFTSLSLTFLPCTMGMITSSLKGLWRW